MTWTAQPRTQPFTLADLAVVVLIAAVAAVLAFTASVGLLLAHHHHTCQHVRLELAAQNGCQP